MHLLLYFQEQFAMSLHLLCSTILHLWLLLCAHNSAVESYRHLICHLSTFRLFAHTACVVIYISFVVMTSSWVATWKASLLWCLLFMNKWCWWDLLRVKCVCYYMFTNSLPRHCTYCAPLFYICGYYYVHTTALLKVKDI